MLGARAAVSLASFLSLRLSIALAREFSMNGLLHRGRHQRCSRRDVVLHGQLLGLQSSSAATLLRSTCGDTSMAQSQKLTVMRASSEGMHRRGRRRRVLFRWSLRRRTRAAPRRPQDPQRYLHCVACAELWLAHSAPRRGALAQVLSCRRLLGIRAEIVAVRSFLPSRARCISDIVVLSHEGTTCLCLLPMYAHRPMSLFSDQRQPVPRFPVSFAGPEKRFANPTTVHRQIRERFLLFVKCIESKPGDEPKHPYLYPTAGGK